MDELRLSRIFEAVGTTDRIGFVTTDENGGRIFVSFSVLDARSAIIALLHALDKSEAASGEEKLFGANRMEFQMVRELGHGILTADIGVPVRLILTREVAETLERAIHSQIAPKTQLH